MLTRTGLRACSIRGRCGRTRRAFAIASRPARFRTENSLHGRRDFPQRRRAPPDAAQAAIPAPRGARWVSCRSRASDCRVGDPLKVWRQRRGSRCGHGWREALCGHRRSQRLVMPESVIQAVVKEHVQLERKAGLCASDDRGRSPGISASRSRRAGSHDAAVGAVETWHSRGHESGRASR